MREGKNEISGQIHFRGELVGQSTRRCEVPEYLNPRTFRDESCKKPLPPITVNPPYQTGHNKENHTSTDYPQGVGR